MMLRPGEILKGKYRIEREIYKGGMGTVYICTDVYSSDHYVVKHPLFDGSHDGLKVEKLKVEASILKTLSHPHIVRYIDSFEEKGVFYMVTEYIRGKDMKSLFMNKPATESQVRQYCRKLLEALEYLHNLNIIHRDIKPANIMVTSIDIKLIDFGGAKMRFTSVSNKKKTYLYTPGYGAPEQQAGGFCFQSDIFAVGATLYFLLTGKHPCTPPPLSPSKESSSVGRNLDNVIKKATSFDPNQRYQTVSEMRSAIFGAYSHGTAFDPRVIIGSREYRIGTTPFTLGRGGGGVTPNVKIDDPEQYISRIHAKIVKDAGGNYYIEDCSINGTFASTGGMYKKIARQQLRDNDVIALCWSSTKGPYMLLKFKTS
jgi:serine/threonine protein kinase